MRAGAIAVVVAVSALGLASASGCYHPNIADGAFVCGPGMLCPDGFSCISNVCVQPGSDFMPDSGTSGAIFSGALGSVDLSGMTGILDCSSMTGSITLRNGATETPVIAVNADGFTRVQQANGPLVSIWSFQSLLLPPEISIKSTADSDGLPVFATADDLTIGGPIDWRGFGGFGQVAGKGEGLSKMSGVDSGGQSGTGDGGGGGGGFFDVGQTGAGTGGGAGGLSYGTPDLNPFHAGSGGGGGGNVGGGGGNGGGSFGLIAQGTLSLGAQCTIDVSGFPGRPGGTGGGGGGGGGSGGSILLSGATVNLDDGHSLTAIGGIGGTGTMTGALGGNGSVGRIWIGGSLASTPNANPSATLSDTPVTMFPQ